VILVEIWYTKTTEQELVGVLHLKGITKKYQTGDFEQVALNEINLSFRQQEFVAILGQSGAGKTTLLNVIGGLDQYDSGDLIINGRSTKDFSTSDWDAYRNNSIGFVFQGYNLIPHLSVLANVELGMTLSGVSTSEKRSSALVTLAKVGLEEHIHKNRHNYQVVKCNGSQSRGRLLTIPILFSLMSQRVL